MGELESNTADNVLAHWRTHAKRRPVIGCAGLGDFDVVTGSSVNSSKQTERK